MTLTAADMKGNVQLACSAQSDASTFGAISLDSAENTVSYTRSVEDADDTLSLSAGLLSVHTPDGNAYSLDDGALRVESDFFGTVTASATVFAESPARIVEFSYNLDGMRAKKKVTILEDETTTYYTYSGTKLTHLVCGTDSMHFFYDAHGRPAIVQYNDGSTESNYTYVHNLQGDIAGILDSTGTLVVEYKYDSWGKPISTTGSLATTLGVGNPFRYRRYVYDEETEYYYLRSRYYDPGLKRFINPDILLGEYGKINSNNLFCYCKNSPIIASDKDGFYTIVVIWDNRPDESEGGKGFPEQAKHFIFMYESVGITVIQKPYTSIEEFRDAWNGISDPVDEITIIGHGAPGSIDCAGKSLVFYDPEKSNEVSANYGEYELQNISANFIQPYTCNRATPKNGISAAEGLSSKSGNATVASGYYAKINYLFKKFPYWTKDDKRIAGDPLIWMRAGSTFVKADDE